MNVIGLIEKLPIDLLFIVSGFYPKVLFVLPMERLVKCDWFNLIKMNFGLIYSRRESTNEEMMKVYMEKCLWREGTIFVSGGVTSLLRGGRLLRCGNNESGTLGLGDNRSRSRLEEVDVGGKEVVEIKGNEF
ncbi:MAG: hypothetical protein Hyperionvirus51_1, partial [Hyperionvirus sp.]